MFTNNTHSIDRIVRVVLGLALAIIGLVVVSGVGGIIMAVVGGILLATAAIGWCPIYAGLGLSTATKE